MKKSLFSLILSHFGPQTVKKGYFCWSEKSESHRYYGQNPPLAPHISLQLHWWLPGSPSVYFWKALVLRFVLNIWFHMLPSAEFCEMLFYVKFFDEKSWKLPVFSLLCSDFESISLTHEASLSINMNPLTVQVIWWQERRFSQN